METSHYPTVAQNMHGLSTTMKKMKMQVHKPQSLLTFGVVVLMATLVWGVRADTTTESGPSGEMLKPLGRKNTENMNAQNHALAWHDQPARK